MSVATTISIETDEVKVTYVIIMSVVCTIFAFGACYFLFACQRDDGTEGNRSSTIRAGLI
jgi:hypothetical protein